MWFRSSRTLGKKRRFKPRIEQLENRVCPSVTVTAAPLVPGRPAFGTRLDILGDSGADTINIQDSGNGSITVTDGTGQWLGQASGVRSIRLEGGSGNDTISYKLLNPLTVNQSVYIELGSGGNNYANLDFSPGIQNASLTVCVTGSVGNDTILASVGTLTHARSTFFLVGGDGNDNIQFGAPSGLDAQSSMNVMLNGGKGNDNLQAAYSGLVFGALSVAANGGDGADDVNINIKVEEDSTGKVAGWAAGDAGNDKVTLYMNDYSGDLIRSTLSLLRATIVDTPSMTDIKLTPNVTVASRPPRFSK